MFSSARSCGGFILGPGSGESRASSLGDNTCDRVIIDTGYRVIMDTGYSVIMDTGYSVIIDTGYSTVQCHLVTERTGGDQLTSRYVLWWAVLGCCPVGVSHSGILQDSSRYTNWKIIFLEVTLENSNMIPRI